jgi:hypothetical protein
MTGFLKDLFYQYLKDLQEEKDQSSSGLKLP